MTTLIPTAPRRSRFLFDWDARACLAAPNQALDALTGQVATFVRASTKLATDAAGAVRAVPHSLAAFDWTADPVTGLMVPGVLLEAARTNVLLWSRDLTNAAWTKTSVTPAKTQTGVDGVASSASLLTASAANGTALQAVTLASSSRVASAYVKRVTGSGTIQMTTDNGATWTTIAVTAAWSRVAIPAQTLANPTTGFRLVTSGDAIAVDLVQNETGPNRSSAIATTSAAVARAADALSFPFLMPPRSSTWYASFIESGTIATGAQNGLLGIGDSGLGSLFIYNDGSAHYAIERIEPSTAISTTGVTPTPSAGQRVELRGAVAADGSMYIGQSINGGTESVTVTAAALAFSAAFVSTILRFNDRANGGNAGFASMQTVRVAGGVQTLATMRGA